MITNQITDPLSSPPKPARNCFAGSFDHLLDPTGGMAFHRDWVVAYQIWCLNTRNLKKNIRFHIAEKNILREGSRSQNKFQGCEAPKSQEFRFPVALSPSLSQAFIMGAIIQMNTPTTNDAHEEYTMELLFDPKCPYTPGEDIMLLQPHRPQYPSGQEDQDPAKAKSGDGLSESKFHEWLRCCFSPNERYIYVVKGDGPPCAAAIFSTWILDIYQKSESGLESTFKLIARTGVRLNGQATHALIFHPTRPVVAISMMSITGMWQFMEKGTLDSRVSLSKI